jgi:hypothetical protein
MSTSVAGYSAASDLIDLDVQCLTGEALTLQVAGTTLGKAVRGSSLSNKSMSERLKALFAS